MSHVAAETAPGSCLINANGAGRCLCTFPAHRHRVILRVGRRRLDQLGQDLALRAFALLHRVQARVGCGTFSASELKLEPTKNGDTREAIEYRGYRYWSFMSYAPSRSSLWLYSDSGRSAGSSAGGGGSGAIVLDDESDSGYLDCSEREVKGGSGTSAGAQLSGGTSAVSPSPTPRRRSRP